MLTESGHNVPFISFSDFGFTTPNTSTFETELDEVDAEVRNALKKMRKKDYLTREKVGCSNIFKGLCRFCDGRAFFRISLFS